MTSCVSGYTLVGPTEYTCAAKVGGGGVWVPAPSSTICKSMFFILKSLRLSRFCLEFILDTSSLLIIQLIDIAIYQTTIKTYYTVLWQSSMRSSILQYVVHVVEQACSQYCSQACSMFIRAYISTPVDKLPFCPLLKFLADIKM